jgi:hypothetical protein
MLWFSKVTNAVLLTDFDVYVAHSSRWCTSDLHSVSSDVKAFVPLWHQGLYLFAVLMYSMSEMDIKTFDVE